MKSKTKSIIIGLVAGLLIIGSSLIFLRENKLLPFLIVIGVIISILPFVVGVVLVSGKQKEKEEKFLDFVRDLVENVKSGAPVSKSIQNLRRRDYGVLTGHVAKLGNQIAMGIPLTKALLNMAGDINSRVISRSVGLISEAERAGGDIGTILESVANSVNQTETLKKEQKSAVFNLIVQGYIIFIVFIVIMLVLQYFILPMTEGLGGSELTGVSGLSLNSGGMSADEMSRPMMILLIVQSFFAGLVIGKISEGSIKDGIKHSFILVALALLIYTGAGVLIG